MNGFFDAFPLWLVFLFTTGLILLCIEGGIRLGRRNRSEKSGVEKSIGAMAGSTAGLLAFMLAVTYRSASSRHEDRKQLVVKEANAIETTYLRAGFLPPSSRDTVRKLLGEYVDIRVDTAKDGADLSTVLGRAASVQQKLWTETEAVAQKESASIPLGLFVESLNEVIDLHLVRLTAAVRNRVPWTSWATLYLLAVLAMFKMGYRIGVGAERSYVASIALVLAFSSVLFLIADLDRPYKGLIRVSQQAMLDLQQKIGTHQ